MSSEILSAGSIAGYKSIESRYKMGSRYKGLARPYLTFGLCLFLGAGVAMAPMASHAHEAPRHEHSEIVPLPDYNPPQQGASALQAFAALQSFSELFNDAQIENFTYPLYGTERRNWSNLPAGYVRRDGMRVGDMSDKQRSALFDILSATLGPSGYERVAQIIAAEALLSGGRNNGFGWHPDNYFFALFGTPSETGQWALQFGGHHMAVNIAFEDGQIETISPTHLGSEPVTFSYKGKDYSIMTDMHEAALSLYNSLPSSLQKQTGKDLGRIGDMLYGPGAEGYLGDKVGVSGADLNAQQRSLLLKLISKWISVQPDEDANRRMVEIEAEIEQTSFAWNWNKNPVDTGYYRIQGPSVIIEHVSFGSYRRVGSDRDGHYHTVYRNPKNDYGRAEPLK